ncbi:unnamed protein product [Protopolystoma xenopodis]|uniref:Uncharacterized protein n=1 Tax=Protopolystoma xenopodis TaxID=117903 RepID=A0A3S5FGB4_9PLAT|nr:unnamed protein product [Protopolystoma xenopodis]
MIHQTDRWLYYCRWLSGVSHLSYYGIWAACARFFLSANLLPRLVRHQGGSNRSTNYYPSMVLALFGPTPGLSSCYEVFLDSDDDDDRLAPLSIDCPNPSHDKIKLHFRLFSGFGSLDTCYISSRAETDSYVLQLVELPLAKLIGPLDDVYNGRKEDSPNSDGDSDDEAFLGGDEIGSVRTKAHIFKCAISRLSADNAHMYHLFGGSIDSHCLNASPTTTSIQKQSISVKSSVVTSCAKTEKRNVKWASVLEAARTVPTPQPSPHESLNLSMHASVLDGTICDSAFGLSERANAILSNQNGRQSESRPPDEAIPRHRPSMQSDSETRQLHETTQLRHNHQHQPLHCRGFSPPHYWPPLPNQETGNPACCASLSSKIQPSNNYNLTLETSFPDHVDAVSSAYDLNRYRPGQPIRGQSHCASLKNSNRPSSDPGLHCCHQLGFPAIQAPASLPTQSLAPVTSITPTAKTQTLASPPAPQPHIRFPIPKSTVLPSGLISGIPRLQTASKQSWELGVSINSGNGGRIETDRLTRLERLMEQLLHLKQKEDDSDATASAMDSNACDKYTAPASSCGLNSVSERLANVGVNTSFIDFTTSESTRREEACQAGLGTICMNAGVQGGLERIQMLRSIMTSDSQRASFISLDHALNMLRIKVGLGMCPFIPIA